MNSHLRCHSSRGAVVPLVALLLPVMLVLAGLVINIAYIQLTTTQLQISTDIAAKAAGRTFAIEQDKELALEVANQFGALNPVGGDALVFNDSDLRVGTSTLSTSGQRYEFTEYSGTLDDDAPMCNALEVVGLRTAGSASGAVNTFFPNLMGKTSFEISTTSVSTQVEVDIALVLDRSGSMAYADNEPAVYPPIPAAAPTGWYFGDPAPPNARWLDAVVATNSLLHDLNHSSLDEKVALITYADTAVINQGLTTSYSLISEQLNAYSMNLTGGGTNIGAGLQAGEAELSSTAAREFAAKVVIILTDGKKTVGENPLNWAHALADDGVMIVTVTFAAEADQSLMQRVADIGNGFHVHADNASDLRDAFRYIGRRLPTLLTR